MTDPCIEVVSGFQFISSGTIQLYFFQQIDSAGRSGTHSFWSGHGRRCYVDFCSLNYRWSLLFFEICDFIGLVHGVVIFLELVFLKVHRWGRNETILCISSSLIDGACWFCQTNLYYRYIYYFHNLQNISDPFHVMFQYQILLAYIIFSIV